MVNSARPAGRFFSGIPHPCLLGDPLARIHSDVLVRLVKLPV